MPTNVAPPTGPNGPYGFGFPDTVVGINFPNPSTTKSKPWWWFVERVQPSYFQYISKQAGGHEWQRSKNFPLIKILPIDTQPLVPTPFVGFNDVDTAARQGVPDGTFGRFSFQNQFFWDVIGQRKPEFSSVLGIPTQTDPSAKKTSIATTIQKATNTWNTDWNKGADAFNTAASGVSGGGSYDANFLNGFKVPWPRGFTLPQLQAAPSNTYYFGAIPPTALFETGQAFFWKQAQAFRFKVGQLDDTLWDMSVFPPQPVTFITGGFASAKTHDYSGYGQVDFPLSFNVV